MKKIAPGYYEGQYGGIEYSIHKVEEINPQTKNKWYWMIKNEGRLEGGQDWYGSKKMSVLAVKEFIDDMTKTSKI